MDQGIHECMDGEVPRSALEYEELRAVDELETLVEEVLAFVRETPAPNVTATVMQGIRELEAEGRVVRAGNAVEKEETAVGRFRSSLERLWAPRNVRLRPAWALAGLVLVATGIGLLPFLPNGTAPVGSDLASELAPVTAAEEEVARPERAATAVEPVLYVRFELESSRATSVSLAGSFSEWQPRYELAETRPGHWTALVPLEPGVHDYAFVVDGERWVPDPDAIPVDDGFGGVNSRVALLAPGSEEPRSGRSS